MPFFGSWQSGTQKSGYDIVESGSVRMGMRVKESDIHLNQPRSWAQTFFLCDGGGPRLVLHTLKVPCTSPSPPQLLIVTLQVHLGHFPKSFLLQYEWRLCAASSGTAFTNCSTPCVMFPSANKPLKVAGACSCILRGAVKPLARILPCLTSPHPEKSLGLETVKLWRGCNFHAKIYHVSWHCSSLSAESFCSQVVARIALLLNVIRTLVLGRWREEVPRPGCRTSLIQTVDSSASSEVQRVQCHAWLWEAEARHALGRAEASPQEEGGHVGSQEHASVVGHVNASRVEMGLSCSLGSWAPSDNLCWVALLSRQFMWVCASWS